MTGGAGFIGSHVVDELLRMGHEVVVLDDLSGGRVENVPGGAHLVVAGCGDSVVVDWLFAAYPFDFVFHLAAYAAEGLSHFVRRFNYENNLIGSVTLINAAVNCGTVRRFVFTSSIAVYGTGQVPMCEEMVPAPEDPYGIAKLAVEQDLAAAGRMFGMEWTVFRPHNVYGERQNLGDRYRNVIGIFMNQAMRGEPFTIFGDGGQARAFTHVADVAPTVAGCVGVPGSAGQVFNVGGSIPTTVAELARLVATAMGVELRVDWQPERAEVRRAWPSHERARAVFGHGGQVDLADGIRRMAAWAKGHGPQERSTFGRIEVHRNLPPVWLEPAAANVDKQAVGRTEIGEGR